MEEFQDLVRFSLRTYLEYQQMLGLSSVERIPASELTHPPDSSQAAPGVQVSPARSPGMAAGQPQDAIGEVAELPDDLGRLKQLALSCNRCRLADERTTVVFGEGNPHARLVFVGEGPGEHEDREGLPFIGLAGQLLTKIIGAMGFVRAEVYITNIVKCRPPLNRDPLPDEAAACRGYLLKQLDIIRPTVIVALGRVAAQNLLGTTELIGQLRGRFHEFQGVSVMPTYHPAALLRNPELKKAVWNDMKLVVAALGRTSA